MALTHQEKDDVIKQLKQKVRDLEIAAKVAISTETSMDQKAFTFIKRGRDYYLVILAFADGGIGKVVEEKNYGPDPAIALYKGKQYLVEEILMPLNR